jgi:hypothetical protein
MNLTHTVRSRLFVLGPALRFIHMPQSLIILQLAIWSRTSVAWARPSPQAAANSRILCERKMAAFLLLC